MSLRESLPQVKTELPGPKAKAVLERRAAIVPAAISTIYPLVIERAEGAMIEDPDGNVFLDWVGGVGVMNVGYSQPEVVEAVREQAGKFFHSMMNITANPRYIEFAEAIAKASPVKGDPVQVMLANSGAEADENAVKIARSATGRPNIIVFSGAFHGRTALTMTMTAKKAYSIGMGPFPDGVYRAEFPYLYRAPGGLDGDDAIAYYVNKLEEVFENASPPQHVAAIVFEPVQGEGGFVPAPLEWVKAVRAICDKHGILLVADEVQTGFARSGRLFSSDYYKEGGFPVDIVTFAKSVAGGLPLSGVICAKEVMDRVTKGTIGGTFNGNAVSCAAALAVLKKMQDEDYPAKALAIADTCMARFNAWKEKYPAIGDVRGLGAMMGVEYIKPEGGAAKTPNPELVGKIVAAAWKKGLILESAGTYGNVIRFLCPLCVTDAQLAAGLDIYEACIEESL
ncbi:MAG: aspartate aminotransferase family protein [Clostridiales Family XIII bacterium]|jgi:4-aminobutyrate aminotransferase/(S)-3-amino-2-methylpropionate transaminase|nr:aspartate aminotransferase family protein [Clostridiales Family XIII bacterium]